jgi:hypothetical protein
MFPCWWEVLPAEGRENTLIRKATARLGRCLMTLFRIPFGPDPCQLWVPWWPVRSPRDWLISVYLRGHTCVRVTLSVVLINAGSDGSPPGEIELQGCRPGLPPSRSLRASPPGTYGGGGGGKKEWELLPVSLSSSIATDPQCPRIPAHRSTDRSSNRSADRSPTFVGGWYVLSERKPSWFAIAFSTGSSGLFYPEY